MDAPLSIRPAVILNTMPRFLATPLYWQAMPLFIVVDISPYSTGTPPRE